MEDWVNPPTFFKYIWKVKESETSSDKETGTLDVQSLEDAPEDAGDELSVISKSFPGAQIINEET